jgi:hypothetical protein
VVRVVSLESLSMLNILLNELATKLAKWNASHINSEVDPLHVKLESPYMTLAVSLPLFINMVIGKVFSHKDSKWWSHRDNIAMRCHELIKKVCEMCQPVFAILIKKNWH